MVTTVKSGTGIGAGGALNLIPVKVMSVILDTNHELAEKKGGYDALGTISYIKVSDCIKTPILDSEIIDSYSGVRPLIKSRDNYHNSSRDFFIQENDSLLTIFGGKWTTSPSIARKIVTMI